MFYEINIAKNGNHFFATHPRSITDRDTLKEVYTALDKAFPSSEGYTLTVSKDEQVTYRVDMDAVFGGDK